MELTPKERALALEILDAKAEAVQEKLTEAKESATYYDYVAHRDARPCYTDTANNLREQAAQLEAKLADLKSIITKL